ncbi:MAG: hypothetical protein WBP82_08445 [Leuconostoc mesenteroides]
MERFAKVFDDNIHQLLVRKGKDSDGDYKLSMIMMFDGAEVDIGPVFHGDNAEAELDDAFNRFDDEAAKKFLAAFADCKTTMDFVNSLK